jgi:endoglycosylceramidase
MHQDVWGEALGGNGAPAWAAPQCNQPPDIPLAAITGQWFADYFTPDTQAAFSNFWADGDPDIYCTGPVQTRFVAMWQHLASRLVGHPALAGYDLMNEPWPGVPPGAFEVAQLYPFYERLVAAIRAVDPTTIILFEPPISKSAGLPAVPVGLSDRNAVYAPHLYTETSYSGGSLTTHAATDDADLAMDQLEAATMHVPAWIGEWGAFFGAGYEREVYDLLDRRQLGDAYWHYTQGYADGLQSRPLADDGPHIRVYPQAFPGEATWTFDPDARMFRMTVEVGPDAPPVVLAVPSRLYPDGAAFESDGAVTTDGERATWTLPADGRYTILIGPTA